MGIPAGISTATVTFGVPVTFQGDQVPVTATVSPSADIVWTADGTPLVAFIETTAPIVGAQGQFILPHVDQNGFIDGSAAAYKNWYYTVTLKYMHTSDTRTVTKVVQPVVGQTTIDLDLCGNTPALQPYTGPQAVATSVVGQTGAITGAMIAADPALSATYVPKPAGIADGQVPTWQASTSTWVAGSGGGSLAVVDGGNATSTYTSTNIDGGSATS